MTRNVARRLTLAGLAVGISAHAQPKRYLVQFKKQSTFDAVARGPRTGTANGAAVPRDAQLMNLGGRVSQALTHVKVLVISTDDAAAVAALAKHPAIALVEEEIMHKPPAPAATWSNVTRQVARTITPDLVTRPWGIDAVRAPAAWSVTEGDAARVMVLDTGVDQDHPALRSRFEKGLNFTSNDPAAFDDREGHGTHVAGTILGDGSRGGVVGVAPRARLLSGKVCAKIGCSNVAIAAGLDWAIAEGVDVVNMSLSGDTLTGIEAAALARVERAGIVIAAASGNDGVGYIGYPAAVSTVLAVGAVTEQRTLAEFSQWGPELALVAPGVDVVSSIPRGTGREGDLSIDGITVASKAALGSPAGAFEGTMVDVSFGLDRDYAAVDARDQIVLIKRGKSKFAEKVKIAIAHGARGIVFVNNAPGLMKATLSEDGSEVAVPAAMIDREVGDDVSTRIARGERVRMSLTVRATDYADLQGTSMATPHVAGVLALVRAANRNLTAAEVRDIVRTTATPIAPNANNRFGRGLVNAEAAVARALAGVSPAAGPAWVALDLAN